MNLTDVLFFDQERGIAIGDAGVVLTTTNGGNTWQPQSSGTTVSLVQIGLGDNQRVVVVDENANVIISEDHGKTWRKGEGKPEDAIAALSSPQPKEKLAGGVLANQKVVLSDQMRQVAVGDFGTIVLSEDGGKEWNAIAYQRYPAPWYYAVCTLLFTFAGFGIRTASVPVESPLHKRSSVTDILASDRPLRWSDSDPLNFHEIARGLSRFVRNVRTEPPLTIAVTGEWGTGKSSLMGLLKEDLSQRGFQPVWFNAWHHQKGENLLASLFANIRSQAIPPLDSLAGLNYRWRLLSRRSARHWLKVGFVAAFVVTVLTVFWNQFDRLHGTLESLAGWSKLGGSAEILAGGSVLAILAGLLAPMITIGRFLKGFGVNPVDLFNATSSAKDAADAKLRPGARYRLAQEFEDVTSASLPYPMVIIIDDLDRYAKENVMEILEVVNFLASSGQCFIVLGMARKWVETCIGLSFSELAAESGDKTQEPDQDTTIIAESFFENDKRDRRAFAIQYLEKLINIEVPIPQPEPEQSVQLLAPETLTPPDRSLYRRTLLSVIESTWRARPWLAALAGIVLGVMLGLEVPTALDAEKVLLPTRIEGVANETGRSGNGPNPLPEPDSTEKASSAFFPALNTEATWPTRLLTGVFFVLLATWAVMLLLRRAELQTDDSPEFRDALRDWHPWVVFRRHTPRTIKRYLNRVRYVAMRYRQDVYAVKPPRQRPPRRGPSPRGGGGHGAHPALHHARDARDGAGRSGHGRAAESETYLGSHAGARVMRGHIQRGDGENIMAVIWFCDLRDSTPLAASMTQGEFLGVLNQFFDCMAGAVHEHGGQVLRFIGDAALAIFPITDNHQEPDTNSMTADEARAKALAAAVMATKRIEVTNLKRIAKSRRPLGYGIALHMGEVTYGNIGTRDRLEFTVIGDAAIRAARVESMCKELQESILLSSEVAVHFPDKTRSLGFHNLRGVDEPVELFTLTKVAYEQT